MQLSSGFSIDKKFLWLYPYAQSTFFFPLSSFTMLGFYSPSHRQNHWGNKVTSETPFIRMIKKKETYSVTTKLPCHLVTKFDENQLCRLYKDLVPRE